MIDYSIELAHIYADEDIGDDQIRSLEEGAMIIKQLSSNSKSFSVSILIDDYSVPNFTVDPNELIDLAKSHGISVDFIVREARLSSIADLFIKELNSEVLNTEEFPKSGKHSLVLTSQGEKIGIRDYYNNHQKNTCASLIAVWQLARLGVYELEKEAFIERSDKPFAAVRTITVLPEKYRDNENKAAIILRNSRYAHLVGNIEHVFF